MTDVLNHAAKEVCSIYFILWQEIFNRNLDLRQRKSIYLCSLFFVTLWLKLNPVVLNARREWQRNEKRLWWRGSSLSIANEWGVCAWEKMMQVQDGGKFQMLRFKLSICNHTTPLEKKLLSRILIRLKRNYSYTLPNSQNYREILSREAASLFSCIKIST